ncbi:hypothetical protein [Paenibacillus sp. FSL R10-2734]|uniref:hypothetical protein n=1 Tax=Paenibacillus sp. FSL R10-2734 TaxID=2954691 RepID=UPI0030DAB343
MLILGFQPQYAVIKSGNLRITAIGSPKLSGNGEWITELGYGPTLTNFQSQPREA